MHRHDMVLARNVIHSRSLTACSAPAAPGTESSRRFRTAARLLRARHRRTQQPNTGARPGPGTGQMQKEPPGAATTASIPYCPPRRRAGDDLRLQAADGEPKGEAGERQCKALCHKGERRRLKGESSRRRAAAPAASPAPRHSLLVAAIRFFPSFSNSLINLLVFSSSASWALTRSLNQGLSR